MPVGVAAVPSSGVAGVTVAVSVTESPTKTSVAEVANVTVVASATTWCDTGGEVWFR